MGDEQIIYRDAGTGQITTADYANAHPDTTTREEVSRSNNIDIIFDGPPGPAAFMNLTFVEIHEAGTNRAVSVGTWVELGGDRWALRIPYAGSLR